MGVYQISITLMGQAHPATQFPVLLQGTLQAMTLIPRPLSSLDNSMG